jgi:L-alanine-DL-glutamate epimerase-like enolase superfamily enzyme
MLASAGALWLEEPFATAALGAYRELAGKSGHVKLAGGEGCHTFHQARNMVDYAYLGFLQIDAGRIGGITPAKQAADYAHQCGVQFVNHTFTSHLALSASMQPFAGFASDHLCEYPFAPSELARAFECEALLPREGQVCAPNTPGLGVTPDPEKVRPYTKDVEIVFDGRVLYRTPQW